MNLLNPAVLVLKVSLLVSVLVSMLCPAFMVNAEESEPDAGAGSEPTVLDELLPATGPLKTKQQPVDMIADDEFKPALRDNLPQMVEKIQIERLASDSPYVMLPHRPNYVLPLSYQSRPSDREQNRVLQHYTGDPDAEREAGNDHLEAVFQLSIKYRLSEGLLGKFSSVDVAYTNRSFWQAYNSDISRPFRETNHEPELIFSWQPQNKWVDYFSLAINHQSNGQTSSMSRSWNRVIAQVASVSSTGIYSTRIWWRLPEESKADPFDPADNDNPDIDDYMGNGEFTYIYVMGNHNISTMLRNNLNPDKNRGAIEVGWTFPLNRKIKGFVQYFNGYGESLIDYNRYQERIGVGIKLSDWF
ncbi:phospholipase A [Thalassolituus pacificus]|uniref:Phospholipase A1 n=1 Tax=Thalassolituus pacificus TaxID=2975440 RepID=A0A9X2WD34_9GAMM|nr:phospholipase A [Thalassolituus pacificus]MCT7357910.1 phospholipase A [Thalassolituus pacificus]